MRRIGINSTSKMKKLIIKQLTHLKSPIDVYWPDGVTLKVKANKPYRYDSDKEQLIDSFENDKATHIDIDWPLIKGLDNRNCAFLNFKAQWVPCDKSGNEVEIIQ